MCLKLFNFKIYCVLSIFFFGFAGHIRGQNLNLLLPYLNEKDKKTVEKAMDEIKNAGELIKDANQYYNEAMSLQSNYEMEEATLQKKLKSAESKAIDIQLKADKIYKTTNKTIINICTSTLKDKETSNESVANYISAAVDMIGKAEENRKEADAIKNVYEKGTKLNDASGFESAAIENYISAIALANNDVLPVELKDGNDDVIDVEIKNEILLSLADTTVKNSGIAGNSNITLNQQAIDRYNNYILDPNIPEPILVNRSGISGLDSNNLNAAADYFQNYNRTGGVYQSAGSMASSDTSFTDSTKIWGIAEKTSSNEDQYNKTNDLNNSKSDQETQAAINTNTKKTRERNKQNGEAIQAETGISLEQDNTVRFMVQLAASRIPLTRSQIWAIYPGNLTIEVMKDKNWYKYRITGFRIFSQANRIAIESGVSSAYVLSAIENKEINLVKAREMTRNIEELTLKNNSKSVVNVPDYYIQVAASRTPIPPEDLKLICNELASYREVIEEGWFKYQYYSGTSYDDAIKIVNSISCKSFVVAYKGGTKINLYKIRDKAK